MPRVLRQATKLRPSCDSVGFSLVELLVTLGVVAVLAAILVPAVQKVREQSGNARCVSNLRQIGAGMSLYSQDQGVYPYHITGNTRWFDGSSDAMSFFSGPYLNISERSSRFAPAPSASAKGRLFDCPVMNMKDKEELGPEEWTSDYFDYAQNISLCGRAPGSIPRLSKTVLVAEGGNYSRVKAKGVNGLTYTANAPSGPGGTAWNYADRPPLVFVHRGGGNFLFVDGHVGWHTSSEMEEEWFNGK